MPFGELSLGLGLAPAGAASGASAPVPALSLDFTNMDASGLSAAGVTFTRATGPSTRVNSSGYIESVANGAPRFHHDWDGTPLGLLIEEARTNFRVYSEDMATNWSTLTSCSPVDSYATSPDNTTSATRFISDTAGGASTVEMHNGNQSVDASSAYTDTIFAKADQTNWLLLNASNFTSPPTGGAYFNLDAGTIGTEQTGISASIMPAVDDWYCCSMTYTTDASDPVGRPSVKLVEANNGVNATRDGSVSILVFGSQFEKGAFKTSYIPTSGSAQTRPAESAVMSDISGWWNDTAATVVATFRSPGVGNRVVWSMDDGAGDIISLATVGTDLVLALYDGGVPIASITLGTITPNITHKAAVSFAADDLQGSLDGATKVTETDTGGVLPVVDRLRIGSTVAGAHLCGPIAEVVVYDTLEDVEALAA